MSLFRDGFKHAGIPARTKDIMLKSCRTGTQKQYASYFKKWIIFVNRQSIDPLKPSINDVLSFLTFLVDSGLSYSALINARFTLSACVLNFGTHPLVKIFMKGVFEL